MKTPEELKEDSKAYFEAYKKENIFHATSDGQYFTEKNKSLALAHQKSLNIKGQEKPSLIKRSDIEATSSTQEKEKSPSESTPNSSWKVNEIKAYLKAQKIDFDSKAVKKDLLETFKNSEIKE